MVRAIPAALFCLLILAGTAHAKVVGIVFDDSGSMVRSYQTALYTLQVLLASLPEEDRVYMVRMSAPTEPIKIDLQQDRQRLLSAIKQWPAPKGWTPYVAVRTLLNTVQQEIKPGEKGIVLVITDGEFLQNPGDGRFTVNNVNLKNAVAAKPCTESLPCSSELKKAYQSFKQQAGGRVEAFFVTLASDPAKAESLRKLVEQQGVRPQLLEVFNGSSANGAFEVAERSDIYPTFTRIASRLLESDAGDGNAASWSGDGVEFQSPLPIKRLTLIRSGTEKSIPPAIGKTSFKTSADTIDQLHVAMAKGDAVSSEALVGKVSNISFTTPLEAHTKHRIAFDGKQQGQGILILSVDAELKVQIAGADGQQLQPAADGVYQVNAGQTVQFAAWLESGGQSERVDLCQLGGIQFNIHSAFHPKQLGMDVKCDAAKRTVNFDTGISGVGTIAISAALKDYLNARANDFIINVREVRTTSLTLQDEPGPDCPQCQAQAIGLAYKDQPGEEVMLKIAPETQDDVGPLEYQLEGKIPAGVKLRSTSGVAIESGASVLIAPGEKINVSYTSDYQADEKSSFTLVARAQSPWAAKASITLTTLPETVPLEIVWLGSSLPGQDKSPVELPLASLQDEQPLAFGVRGLRAGLDRDHLQATASSQRLPVDVELGDGNTFNVRPRYWFCDCFTQTGETDLRVEYNNPKTRQSASTSLRLDIVPSSLISRCWQEVLLALLLLLLLLKFICLMRTSRFHKKLYIAEFMVTHQGARIEQDGVRAHRWYSLLWPLCRDEQRHCYGEFLFQAQSWKDRVYFVNQGDFPDGLTLDNEALAEMANVPLIAFRLGQVLRLVSADGIIYEYELQIVE